MARFSSVPSDALHRLDSDCPSEPPELAGSGLTLHERESGGISLCEVTETLGAMTGSKVSAPMADKRRSSAFAQRSSADGLQSLLAHAETPL